MVYLVHILKVQKIITNAKIKNKNQCQHISGNTRTSHYQGKKNMVAVIAADLMEFGILIASSL